MKKLSHKLAKNGRVAQRKIMKDLVTSMSSCSLVGNVLSKSDEALQYLMPQILIRNQSKS